jgi:nucleotide-binding universal stress UspA family protein
LALTLVSPATTWKLPRNILVGVDGSEISGKAVEFAIKLSKEFSSSLTMVNVIQFPGFLAIQEPTMSRRVDEALDDFRTNARAAMSPFMDKALSRATAEGVNASFEILDVDTSPVEAITNYATAHNVDLIVVGNRGLGGFKRLLTGSVSSGIIDHAHCSVLVVK